MAGRDFFTLFHIHYITLDVWAACHESILCIIHNDLLHFFLHSWIYLAGQSDFHSFLTNISDITSHSVLLHSASPFSTSQIIDISFIHFSKPKRLFEFGSFSIEFCWFWYTIFTYTNLTLSIRKVFLVFGIHPNTYAIWETKAFEITYNRKCYRI